MVYDTYNYGLMGFINQHSHHWGAPHCRIFGMTIFVDSIQTFNGEPYFAHN
jgi:hypothetical protein